MIKKETETLYQLVNKFPERIRDAYKNPAIKINNNFKRVIIIGMGGCYIAGLVLKEFLRKEIKIAVEVYPGYIAEMKSLDNHDLIVLLSYSGETRELLVLFHKLKHNFKENILILTSGGHLLEEAKANKVKLIEIKSDLHQRFTFPYVFFPLLRLFEKSGFININGRVERIVSALVKNRKKIENEAKKIASRFKKRHPLIYGSEYFYPACYRLETSLEEDTKLVSHSQNITEIFHNELEALPDKNFFPILIIDGEETLEFAEQVDFFKKKIKDYYEFGFYEFSRSERIFMVFYFADFLGYYLSKIRKTRMGETPVSDEIKKL